MMHRDRHPRTHRPRPGGRNDVRLDAPLAPTWAPDGLDEAVIDRLYGDLLTDLDLDLDEPVGRGGAAELLIEAAPDAWAGRLLAFPVAAGALGGEAA